MKRNRTKRNLFVKVTVNFQILNNCYNNYNNGGSIIIGNYNNNCGNITVNEETKLLIDKKFLHSVICKALIQRDNLHNNNLKFKRNGNN